MKDILIFSGAGISASAGLKTFEELPHLRDVYSLDFFDNNYEKFWEHLTKLKETVCDVEPTAAHKAIANNGLDVITMNIDGLHQKAGSNRVLEVHGNLQHVKCLCCDRHFEFDVVKDCLFCPDDGGRLKPCLAVYGDLVPEYKEAINILKMYAGRDIVIVGTSFKTGFAKNFLEHAEFYRCKTHIINDNADEKLPQLIQDLQIEREMDW